MKGTTKVATGVAALSVLALLLPSNAWAWGGTEGCTPGYWKNSADTNPRVAELYGINLNAAILDITGLDLGAPADLTIDQAVQLNGGGLNAFYRHLGAAVFNIYYGVDDIDYIEPGTTFTDIVQQALDGDVEGAKNALDAANNLGCSVDAFGNPVD